MAYPLTNSIQFDNASSEYATASDSSSLSITGDITIEFWVKMNETLTSGQSRCLVVKSGLSSSNRGYELLYQNVSGVTSLFFYIFSGGTPTNFFEGRFQFTLTQDEWFHVAMTCDVSAAAASKMKWYINGADMGAGVGTNFGSGTTSIFDSSNALRIGQGDAVIAGYYPDAQFGLVRLWSTLRSQSEINTNKNTVLGSTTNLQAEWTLDNTYSDNSGNSNTLSGVNTPTFITDVPTFTTGFKMATVNASDVPATQTNFPSYVDLSRLGITTLAEAQSVRVYADEAKTTEWAREIVSATEMHVKVPSLTSTVEMYVDWDGVSADYAVTDTYGRNAVWSDYAAVYHLEDLTTDYSGNSKTLTNKNTVGTSTAGQIEGAADFGTANNKALHRDADVLSYTDLGSSWTISFWIYPTESGTNTNRIMRYILNNGSLERNFQLDITTAGKLSLVAFYGSVQSVTGATTISINTQYKVTIQYSGGAMRMYLNNASEGTPVSFSWGGYSRSTFSEMAIGAEMLNSGDTPTSGFNGLIDETRLTTSAFSANWITTEYNNQSDEAGFWGTWTDVGGGGTFVPRASFFM